MAVDMWKCPPKDVAELRKAAKLQLFTLRACGYKPQEVGTILALALASLYDMVPPKISRKDYADGVGKTVADLIIQMGGN